MLGFYPDSRIVPHLVCQNSTDVFECFGALSCQKSLHLCAYVCVYLLTDFWHSTPIALAELGECPWPGQQCLPGPGKEWRALVPRQIEVNTQEIMAQEPAGWNNIWYRSGRLCEEQRDSSVRLGNAHTCAAVTHPRQLHLDVLPFHSRQRHGKCHEQSCFCFDSFWQLLLDVLGLGMGLTPAFFQRYFFFSSRQEMWVSFFLSFFYYRSKIAKPSVCVLSREASSFLPRITKSWNGLGWKGP